MAKAAFLLLNIFMETLIPPPFFPALPGTCVVVFKVNNEGSYSTLYDLLSNSCKTVDKAAPKMVLITLLALTLISLSLSVF